MHTKTPRIVIDANCINARNSLPAMTELENLHNKGIVRIEKIDVLDTEFQFPKTFRLGLKKSSNYNENIGLGVWDNSRWDHCFWASDDDEEKLTKLLSALWGEKKRSEYSKNEIRDVMHILTAIRSGADFFVTNEKILLEKGKFLEIKVCSPEECLEIIRNQDH